MYSSLYSEVRLHVFSKAKKCENQPIGLLIFFYGKFDLGTLLADNSASLDLFNYQLLFLPLMS